MPPNTDYTLSVYIRCPAGTATYWAEAAYKLGNHSAQDFDANAGTWTLVKKFSDTGPNGNSDTWTQYTAGFNTGSNTQVSVGFKLGSSNAVAPTVKWDALRLQPSAGLPTCRADLDGDGDVDERDFREYLLPCLTGPDNGPPTGALAPTWTATTTWTNPTSRSCSAA